MLPLGKSCLGQMDQICSGNSVSAQTFFCLVLTI